MDDFTTLHNRRTGLIVAVADCRTGRTLRVFETQNARGAIVEGGPIKEWGDSEFNDVNKQRYRILGRATRLEARRMADQSRESARKLSAGFWHVVITE